MPVLNYNELNDVPVGKFVGCAVQSNREILLNADMSAVDVELTINGVPVDFQRVFSAFERATNNDGLSGQQQTTTEQRPINLSGIEEVRSRMSSLQQGIHDVGSNISDSFDNAAEAAASISSDYARDSVNDYSWGPESVSSELRQYITALEESINALEVEG